MSVIGAESGSDLYKGSEKGENWEADFSLLAS